MNRLALLFIAAVALVPSSGALQTKAADTPVFASGTDFIQVPVIVQKSGKHIGGLKKEDFVLRQDGKDQPIASFEEIHAGGTTGVQTQSEFGNQTGNVPQQITIIALDMVNTPNLDRAYFTQEFERYLSKAGKFSGPIAVVAIERTGIHILREFTTDPRLLLSAITKDSNAQPTAHNEPNMAVRQLTDAAISQSETQLAGGGGGDISLANALKLRSADEAMVRFQDRSSRLDVQYVIQQLAQALKGIPGRKSLLLVGSGFKFIDSEIVMKTIDPMHGGTVLLYSVTNATETLNQAAYTWKLLNDANIAVYPIDTRRTVNTAFQSMDTSGANTPSALTFDQNRQADHDILDTFKTIAAATGGKPCFYRTDLDNCLREAIDDDHDYYLLGFYADKNNRKPGWHKIEVKVNEKANVRYRQGFILANFNADSQRKTDIGLALSSPFAYTSLPFSGKFDSFTGDKIKTAKFSLLIPPDAITVDDSDDHIDLDIVAIVRADGGKEAAKFNQHIDRKFSPENIAEIKRIGINYSNRLDRLSPGEYAVWFVVRDNLSGRTGSAVLPLKVP